VFTGLAVQAAEQVNVGDFSGVVDAQGVPSGWQLKVKSGKADLKVVEEDGLHAVRFRSDAASFSLQRQVKVDLQQYPVLGWKWKVNKLPEGGDFRRSKTDDQAAQLFVAFSKTQTLVYLWDSTVPEGFMGDAPSPPFMSVKAIVVRSKSSPTGKWLTESRNVYEDYKKLFGPTDKVPVVSGMRLQINSQHTKTSAESAFADILFKSR
jgi:hypothetical protein